MNVRLIFTLLFLACAWCADAQRAPVKDSILKVSSIEVLQSYKPEVKQAPKPEWMPQLPPVDTTHPVFNYNVPQQTLYYTYNSMPLRPLALGKEVITLPFPDYVKIGAGNLSTIFLDAGIARFTGPGYETNIHLHHFSQKGDVAHQQSSFSGLEAEANMHKDDRDWHVALLSARDQYNFYGGDQLMVVQPDSVKQVFTTVRVLADVKNRFDSDNVINYHPAISASYYHAKLNASEINIGINAPVSYAISPFLDVQGALVGAFTHYTAYSTGTNNNFAELLPGVGFHNGQVSGHALFGLAVGKDSKSYFLPDIQATVRVPATTFVVSAGWQALLRQNTYEQLTTENPYLFSYDSIRQTRSDELFVNFAAASGNHLSFSGRAGVWNFNSLPGYLNDVGDQRKFYVDYVNIKAISFKAAARYHVGNIWSVGASGEYYGFYKGSGAHVWQQPNMRVKGDFMAIPFRKLTLTAYLALLDGIYAKDINHNTVKLDMIIELGGNAEYEFIPRLSAFAQVDNLLSDKYQRWYGYQAYGLNVFGGVRLKF